jgi:hypothetical protein
MSKVLHAAGLGLISVLASAPASAATLVTYTDQAAFLAAFPAAQLEDFNGFPGQPASFNDDGLSVNVGPFALTGIGPFAGGFRYIGFDRIQADTCSNCFGTPTIHGYKFVFSSPIRAFGADYFDAFTGTGFDFTVLGTTFAGPRVNGRPGFFGFSSSAPFTTIVVTGLDEVHGIDNVRFAGVIPEPSTWMLMILGFGMIARALRRRWTEQAT